MFQELRQGEFPKVEIALFGETLSYEGWDPFREVGFQGMGIANQSVNLIHSASQVTSALSDRPQVNREARFFWGCGIVVSAGG